MYGILDALEHTYQNPHDACQSCFIFNKSKGWGSKGQKCFLLMGTKCIDKMHKTSWQTCSPEFCTICYGTISLLCHHLLPSDELFLWFEGTSMSQNWITALERFFFLAVFLFVWNSEISQTPLTTFCLTKWHHKKRLISRSSR